MASSNYPLCLNPFCSCLLLSFRDRLVETDRKSFFPTSGSLRVAPPAERKEAPRFSFRGCLYPSVAGSLGWIVCIMG